MPTPPSAGTIIAWSPLDGVGRVQLESGEVLRFGASACAFPPCVGLAVRVLGAEAHPLGGRRAVALQLASPTSADALLDQAHPLPGLDPQRADVAGFAQLTDEVGLLGVVLRAPLTSRAALRAWLETAGATVDFARAAGPLVTVDRLSLRLWACMAPLARGQGVVSFGADTPFSVRTERTQALAAASLGHEPPRVLIAFAPLVELVRRLAPTAVGIIVHQAGGRLVPADTWLAAAQREPLGAWVSFATSSGGDAVSSGLTALRLPELFVRGEQGPAAVALLEDAARALVALGRVPAPDERLGAALVASAGPEWMRVERG